MVDTCSNIDLKKKKRYMCTDRYTKKYIYMYTCILDRTKCYTLKIMQLNWEQVKNLFRYSFSILFFLCLYNKLTPIQIFLQNLLLPSSINNNRDDMLLRKHNSTTIPVSQERNSVFKHFGKINWHTWEYDLRTRGVETECKRN